MREEESGRRREGGRSGVREEVWMRKMKGEWGGEGERDASSVGMSYRCICVCWSLCSVIVSA